MEHDHYGSNRKKPLEKRSCTDCLCFISFFAFVACWVALASYAYQNSDLQSLMQPIDSAGQVCGSTQNVSNKPYLFFFDITECQSMMIFIHGCQTPQVCLNSCPTSDWSVNEILDSNQSQLNWQEIQKKLICISPDLKKMVNSVETLKNFTSSNLCAKYYLKSTPILNYCVPELIDPENLENFMKNNKIEMSNMVDGIKMVELANDSKEVIKAMIEDITNNYKYIVGGLLIAIIFSLSYILLLRWFSFIIIWTSLLALIGLLSFASYESYIKYESYKETTDTTTEEDIPSINLMNRQSWTNYMIAKFNKKSTWLMFTIVSTFALIILLLIIIFLRKRIKLTIALVVEGSRAILEIKTTLMFPLLQWILYLAVIMWFFAVATCLSTMKLSVFKVKGLTKDLDCVCNNSIYKDGDWCTESKWERYCSNIRTNSTCRLAKCVYDDNVTRDFITGLQLFNVFGAFWLLNFVTAFSQMVLAISFASWYWTFYKKDVPFFTLTISIYKTIRYHLGTVAFGALIIAICNFLCTILLWVETKLKKYDNAVSRAIFTCLRCFFWLLNKFLRFINRNAYIMCAMYGKNFFTSAKQAFKLLTRNVLRLVVVDKVTDFIFFASKIIVMGATIVVFYFEFYQPVEQLKQFAFVDKLPVLNYKWLPMIIVAIGSWVISSTFFHVYSIAVDTLFLCFLEDSERNDGSSERPYYMSLRLMNILGTRNIVTPRPGTSSGANRRKINGRAQQHGYPIPMTTPKFS